MPRKKLSHDQRLEREADRQIKREAQQGALRAARAPEPRQTQIIEEESEFVARCFPGNAIRPLDSFIAPRSRDRRKLRVLLARHLYASYCVPTHLEALWLETRAEANRLPSDPLNWYMSVAQGGSLHKQYTREFLTRQETHWFLNPPLRMTFGEALWYAVARSYSDHHGSCYRIAKSKLAGIGPANRSFLFWKSIARFFCANTLPVQKINDLYDYIAQAKADNEHWEIKGRTAASLTHQMQAWHRDLQRISMLQRQAKEWSGLDEPDFSYLEKGAKPHVDTLWRITQIKTGKALAEEGNLMHHCVYGYASRCVSGQVSIWSLTRHGPQGHHRMLTIEIANAQRSIVQARGFANRLATPHERSIIKRWTGFSLAPYV